MTSLRIGVDIDDVLYPWYTTAHRISEAAGITNGITPSSWAPFEEYGCTGQQWYDVLDHATLSGALYSENPIPGAIDALHRLGAAGHTIHLVTARGTFGPSHAIKAATLAWLRDHAVPHHTLTFSYDKTVVRTDLFADDKPSHVKALRAVGVRAFLVTSAHNVEVDDVLRVASLSDFADAVLGPVR